MTADGSVVAATFVDATMPNGNRHAYIHNAHGWFHLTTILVAAGIDLAPRGWEAEGMQVNGISPDGTLVFGSRRAQRQRLEGFVAELPPGYLASFDVPAVPQTDTSIVGVWTESGGSGGESVVFLADGTYFHIDTAHGTQPAGEFTSGFERGRYHWDASTGAFTFATLQDTNGSVGFSGGERAGRPDRDGVGRHSRGAGTTEYRSGASPAASAPSSAVGSSAILASTTAPGCWSCSLTAPSSLLRMATAPSIPAVATASKPGRTPGARTAPSR